MATRIKEIYTNGVQRMISVEVDLPVSNTVNTAYCISATLDRAYLNTPIVVGTNAQGATFAVPVSASCSTTAVTITVSGASPSVLPSSGTVVVSATLTGFAA